MIYRFNTEKFAFKYIEDDIDGSFLLDHHCHTVFELLVIFEGDIEITLEGIKYRMSRGQSIIIPPFCYHTVATKKAGPYRRLTASFELDAIPQALQKTFLNVSEIAVSSFACFEELKKICKKNSPKIYGDLADALMVKSFYDSVSEENITECIHYDQALQTALQYINQRLYEKITVEEIADSISYSKSAVNYMFKKELNISPKQYILNKKLALAKRLIYDGASPTSVAMKLGYDNYSDFYRIYIKHFNKKPSDTKKT